MKRARRQVSDISRDPFAERGTRMLRWRTHVLGAPFEFTSNSRVLLGIARQAFEGVPAHRFARGTRPALQVELRYLRDGVTTDGAPPRPRLGSGAGLLCGHVDERNFVIVAPGEGRALVQVGDALLKHPRLLRYELIEFAAITLATRAQRLVSLHAGCVGRGDRGVLLMGASGAGKSTLALHAALARLDFLSEDSVFVQPRTLRASGLSAHAHACGEALGLIADGRVRGALRRAPRIQRRSGVRKHEIDLRAGLARLADKPLRIVATVVLSARPPRNGAAIEPLSSRGLRRALRAEQSFALTQPGWREFEARALRAGGFRLGRVPPAEGVAALRELLAGRP